MATSDSAQLKKLGFILLGLGVVMAAVGFFLESKLQLYGGIGAAVVGGAIAFFGMKKG